MLAAVFAALRGPKRFILLIFLAILVCSEVLETAR